MKLRLSSFLDYKHIVIQCHDNPDADALASGYALCYYLHKNDIPVRFIYSGKYQIKKSNLLLMIKSLSIPIEYVTALDMPDLLIMVDCQYGESNDRLCCKKYSCHRPSPALYQSLAPV